MRNRHSPTCSNVTEPPASGRCMRLLALVLLPLLISTTACVARTTRGPATPTSYVHDPDFSAYPEFDYVPAGAVRLEPTEEALKYHDVWQMEFESSGRNGHPENLVHARLYRSRTPGPKKVVVVLPIWGSSEYPPRHIARGYANRSQGAAHIIWLSGETPVFPWDTLSTTASEQEFIAQAQDSAERYRSAVVDIRRLVDWAETQPDLDAGRIALVGFSMSALVAATALGNDSRIDTAVLMMGGAHLADIFATCSKRVADVREHVLSEHGWTLEGYRNFFAELFDPADPIRYAGRYDPQRVLMIDAKFDDCMPSTSRETLWDALGRPERITLAYSHRTAFYSITPIGFNVLRRKIYRFLERAL
jgi:dienelactone hydrolase